MTTGKQVTERLISPSLKPGVLRRREITMASINCDEVVRLAEQLPPHEQRALIAHLQELAEHRRLT